MAVTRRAFLVTAAGLAGLTAALGLPGGDDCLPVAGDMLPAMLPFALGDDCPPATATPTATVTATATATATSTATPAATPDRVWLPVIGR